VRRDVPAKTRDGSTLPFYVSGRNQLCGSSSSWRERALPKLLIPPSTSIRKLRLTLTSLPHTLITRPLIDASTGAGENILRHLPTAVRWTSPLTGEARGYPHRTEPFRDTSISISYTTTNHYRDRSIASGLLILVSSKIQPAARFSISSLPREHTFALPESFLTTAQTTTSWPGVCKWIDHSSSSGAKQVNILTSYWLLLSRRSDSTRGMGQIPKHLAGVSHSWHVE